MNKYNWRFIKKAVINSGISYRLLKFGVCVSLVSWLLLMAQSADALPFRSELNQGNDFYKKENYPQADQIYNKILEKKAKDQKAKFNLGDSLYKEGKYKESQSVFEGLTNNSIPKNLRQAAFYNLGNAFFKQEDYKSAIGSYEEALKIDPKDKDAQFNLDLAKKMLAMPKKENEKEKKKNEQQKKEENKNKEEKQPVDKSGNKNKENEQQQPQPGQMSKEDALRILNALNDKEKHKGLERKAGKGKANVKDW